MKTPLLSTIAIVCLSGPSVDARIGDSLKQIEARYGRPQHVYPDERGVRALGYRFRGFMIVVYFQDGISKCETFMDWPQGDSLPRLSRERATEALALSVPKNQMWRSIPRTKNGEYWVSTDRKTLAFFNSKGTSVQVRDPNFDK